MSTRSKSGSQKPAHRQGSRPSPGKGYELLTLEQAVEYLGPWCNLRWIRRHVYELKTIDSLKIGRRRLVPRSELDRIVAEGWAV